MTGSNLCIRGKEGEKDVSGTLGFSGEGDCIVSGEAAGLFQTRRSQTAPGKLTGPEGHLGKQYGRIFLTLWIRRKKNGKRLFLEGRRFEDLTSLTGKSLGGEE